MAAFGVLHHDGKISPGWWGWGGGGGERPPPFIYHHVQIRSLRPADRADRLTLFHFYPYVYSVANLKQNRPHRLCLSEPELLNF
jgi:hypothetical protein